ncbi:right-handed parallel beta-helix repeat-containing protein [Paenibacillus luteus]|uniref:right-handed parallel beta-helix repeat-containing protein n=1 Tax=Paenibacillus luteus TaxID=2545753 RepID=UPI0011442725|nr:NosD domain-containing protein [Paenibacillus luteus]
MRVIQKLMYAFILLAISTLIGVGIVKAEGTPSPLQVLINEAHVGDTLHIPAGTYKGPIVIDKPLQLVAESGAGATISNTSNEPALQIKANNVSIIGLTILDETIKKQPAILVQANDVLLDDLQIRTGSFGIIMRKANNGKVLNTTIDWAGVVQDRPLKLSDKGNGIDLYDSHGNYFAGNTISSMHDGIYMENSDRNLIEDNQFELLRYGVHCMYTKGTVIRNNIGNLNITGAMIMAVRDVEVSGNQFTKQSENVNSQGILLFDAHHTIISGNHVEGNRVGLYVEQSTKNKIVDNAVIGNFIGIQLLDAEDNDIQENQFVGNVASAEARNSIGNLLESNYWDSFQGIDTDGDGKSETTYAINPFFQSLVKARPAFQLFFQSPGMVFLEDLYQSDRQSWSTDTSPLMQPSGKLKFVLPTQTLQNSAVVGAGLLIVALYFMYLGVRKR